MLDLLGTLLQLLGAAALLVLCLATLLVPLGIAYHLIRYATRPREVGAGPGGGPPPP
jgi:hypothetical protein